MKKASSGKKESQAQAIAPTLTLDELIDEVTEDAFGEQEQRWAFRQAFEDNVALPVEASVAGEPVVVVKFDYDGIERRGLTARCRRSDGRKYVVAAVDVMMSLGSEASRYLAAYRKWMGLSPYLRPSRSMKA